MCVYFLKMKDLFLKSQRFVILYISLSYYKIHVFFSFTFFVKVHIIKGLWKSQKVKIEFNLLVLVLNGE